MPVPGNPKSTYELEPDVKLSLAMWRAQLRNRKVKATEKGIIEALVRATDVDQVGALLETAAASAEAEASTAEAAQTPTAKLGARKRSRATRGSGSNRSDPGRPGT